MEHDGAYVRWRRKYSLDDTRATFCPQMRRRGHLRELSEILSRREDVEDVRKRSFSVSTDAEKQLPRCKVVSKNKLNKTIAARQYQVRRQIIIVILGSSQRSDDLVHKILDCGSLSWQIVISKTVARGDPVTCAGGGVIVKPMRATWPGALSCKKLHKNVWQASFHAILHKYCLSNDGCQYWHSPDGDGNGM